MELVLRRGKSANGCTIGELLIDGQRECFTLEDVVRPDGVKIPGETAIPPGSYDVEISHSPRFKRDLPLLVNVANFTGVRIHTGNTAADTEGCILVGAGRGTDRISGSRDAFDRLFAKLRTALDNGEEVRIEVVSAP